MANTVLIPPSDTDPRKDNSQLHAVDEGPKLNEETDGSMWPSLLSNLRDFFNPVKQAPLKLESRPADNDLILEEEGIFSSLISSFRDAFFPEKLPPLELQSKPIAVVDRMRVKKDPTSTAIAIVIHGLVILLIAYVLIKKIPLAAPAKTTLVTDVKIPPMAPSKKDVMGGGGGQRGPTPVSKGSPPKFADTQIVPPKAPPPEQPKIKIEPTVEVQKDVHMASNMPNFGLPNSPLAGVSMGNGSGTGLGSGNGSGIGPGTGGNIGGGLRHVGGGVSAPVPIYTVEPEFSEEARKAKFAGVVVVYLQVGADGLPSHVRPYKGVGMGLDDKAVEAVRQYRFKPAMENGKPVPVEMYVEVNFQIF
jgi:periplasmic protein TonB